jgi:hypothetical protein
VKMWQIFLNASPSSIYRLLEKTSFHPPYPRRAKTRPFPSFVLGSKQSSTYRGEKSRSRPAQGWAGEMVWYASGCFSPAAALDGLFDQPITPTSNLPLIV